MISKYFNEEKLSSEKKGVINSMDKRMSSGFNRIVMVETEEYREKGPFLLLLYYWAT